METVEQRLAALDAELRDKYNAKERATAAEAGEAMDGGSYPIKDKDDLEKAIGAVGRGGADHDAIRRHIIARAKALGLSSLIPDGWGTDGSLKAENSTSFEGAGITVRVEGVSTEVSSKELAAAVAELSPEQQEQMRAVMAREPQRRKKDRHRKVPLMPEVRHFRAEGLEIREQSATNEIVISGRPIVFNVPYAVRDMFGEFQETMRPGVAASVLEADVRFLFNHDGLPLARTPSTLLLRETEEGVDFEARLDARQQLANDLAIAIERGDVSQMSCGFIVARDQWDDAMENRDIYTFGDLLDVSAVTYPASPTTVIQIANRMALEMPVESRARLRSLIVEGRAGAVLSGANKTHVAAGLEALHALYTGAGGNTSQLLGLVDPDGDGDIDAPPAADASPDPGVVQDGTIVDPGESQSFLDGTGERSAGKSLALVHLEDAVRRHQRRD